MPSAAPLVSVLVPVRDEAPHLARALASLSAQTLADWEALVVDDGSADASAEIAAAAAARDPRIRVLRQGRCGIVVALERARAAARGRYLARLDGDDEALPRRLELQAAALEAEGLAACGGRVELVGARVRDGLRRYGDWLNGLTTVAVARRDVFVECPLAHPALLARRDAVEAVGGYRGVPWPEDYDLVLRLWAHGEAFRNVEEPVLRWRDAPDRLSRTDPRYALDAFVRCKVHHLRRTLLRGGRAAVVWGAGPVGKSFARALLAAGARVEAFVDVDPRKVGKRVYGIPVLAVEHAPRPGGTIVLGAVAGAEGRAQVRRLAAAQGRVEGEDFVAVA